jgi:hypothetical protein
MPREDSRDSGPSAMTAPRHDTSRRRAGAALEGTIAVLAIALLAWTGGATWLLHREYSSMPVETATPAIGENPAAVREESQRFRELTDRLGAGYAFAAAGRADLAQQQFLAALALDPANAAAKQGLAQLGMAGTATPVAP